MRLIVTFAHAYLQVLSALIPRVLRALRDSVVSLTLTVCPALLRAQPASSPRPAPLAGGGGGGGDIPAFSVQVQPALELADTA